MSSQLSATGIAGIEFDPYDHVLQDDPYPTYARLRREDPFHHNEEHDFWVISRHADVHAAWRTDSAYSNAMGVTLDKSAWNKHAHTVMSFLAMDPPRQTRLRRLVSKGFTPRRVNELRPQIQRITEHYLDKALAAGGEIAFDWISEVAGKIPMDVISEMLGVPQSDRDEVRRLADLMVIREDGLRDVPQAGVEASLQLFDYYREHVARRHDQPTDDLTSALIAAADENDRMTDDEVVGFLFLMVVAGNETTTKLLGNALYNSPLQWVVMLAPLAFVLVLSFGINKLSTGAAQALFWVYAAVMGLSMSTIFLAFTATSIATTFFATAAAFLGLSLYGYTTKKDLSGFGTFLIMGVVGILVAMLINLFVQSTALGLAISVIGVLLFAGLTAYDTQKIKSMYFYVRGTDFVGKSVIMGALTLYLDFVNMFTFLLNLLGSRE